MAHRLALIGQDDAGGLEAGGEENLERVVLGLIRDRNDDGQPVKRELEKELTGRETEAWEIIYVKGYKSQIPVIEQAL